ncbi:hypothetical protein B0H15DRAFT_898910 [Mycena belliarum]|uniref:Uncharacterized protein n=1 Tax=Mycena belliarum TaxID=1033014 RepID=A0AAD6XTV8_9AGAR|nr:hypothetical protein B0H15DRAFT_898910 [Mycena belliae]
MLFLPVLALVSLPLIYALATKVDDIHQELIALAAAAGGPIKLDSSSFDLLTTPHRNWSASIEFTALHPRRKCVPCKELHSFWNAVAKAWMKAPQAQRDHHFFATLDFDDGPSVFETLNLESGPVFYTYPATQGPHATGTSAPSRHDLPSGFGAAELAEDLSKHTPVPIPLSAPLDWARWLATAAGLLTFAVFLRFAVPILKSRRTWALVTVLPILILTSGYMFTRISGSAFAGSNGRWIARGPRNQFGKEVLAVSVFYGMLSSLFLILIAVIPYQSARCQRVQIYLCCIVFMLVYSVLVVFYRSKNRGYPFRLFL